MIYKITGVCVDGGWGWGKTGQVQTLVGIRARNKRDALKIAQRMFPGGWKLTKATRMRGGENNVIRN